MLYADTVYKVHAAARDCGIPRRQIITNGFFSKDEILAAAAHVSTPIYLLASLAAFMTAFYMARLFILTFLGKSNPHNHPHESGLSMLIPMGVLAVLSLIGGIIPFVMGFGEWVRFGPAHHAGIDWTVAGVSTGISLLGFALAWFIYGEGHTRSNDLTMKMGAIYTWSYNKCYIDELYQCINRNIVGGLARLSFWIDIHALGAVVDNAWRGTGAAGEELRRAQTGQMQQYAALMLSATVILVVILAALTGTFVKGGQI